MQFYVDSVWELELLLSCGNNDENNVYGAVIVARHS